MLARTDRTSAAIAAEAAEISPFPPTGPWDGKAPLELRTTPN